MNNTNVFIICNYYGFKKDLDGHLNIYNRHEMIK
jgi:hypothetical protein